MKITRCIWRVHTSSNCIIFVSFSDLWLDIFNFNFFLLSILSISNFLQKSRHLSNVFKCSIISKQVLFRLTCLIPSSSISSFFLHCSSIHHCFVHDIQIELLYIFQSSILLKKTSSNFWLFHFVKLTSSHILKFPDLLLDLFYSIFFHLFIFAFLFNSTFQFIVYNFQIELMFLLQSLIFLRVNIFCLLILLPSFSQVKIHKVSNSSNCTIFLLHFLFCYLTCLTPSSSFCYFLALFLDITVLFSMHFFQIELVCLSQKSIFLKITSSILLLPFCYIIIFESVNFFQIENH